MSGTSARGTWAARLRTRHPLFVHDRDQAAMSRMVAMGAVACESAADVASRCDFSVLCLPTSTEVKAVIFGDDGILTSARRGTIIVDQTTGDPAATRAMADTLIQHGIDIVDTPVSGGIAAARAGSIAVIVGGSAEQYARVEPVLQAISSNVFHAVALDWLRRQACEQPSVRGDPDRDA